jgi:excinuclease UvrABC nuclease subunit
MAALAAGFAFGGYHTIPPSAGLYLIYNSVSNNRYVGKAGDLQNRSTEGC